jgi:hypothetical protein
LNLKHKALYLAFLQNDRINRVVIDLVITDRSIHPGDVFSCIGAITEELYEFVREYRTEQLNDEWYNI